MKFATINHQGKNQPVLIQDEQAWLIQELIPAFTGDLPQLISDFDQLKGQLTPKGQGLPVDALEFVAPLQRLPRNIICVDKNYHAHAREFSESGFDSSATSGEHSPDFPIMFTKAVNTIIGPNATIPAHEQVTQQIDYEAELAVVIGKAGRAISKEQAMDHVFGYTIVNDITCP